MPKEQSSIRERQRTDLREPRRYKVTIYNDDFTTMEFVVKILTQVFYKSEAEAETLMLQVHHSDKAVVAGTPLRQGGGGHLQLRRSHLEGSKSHQYGP